MKRHSRLNVRKHSFGMRVVKDWNSLPDWVVAATSLNDFKTKLDKHWHSRKYKTRSRRTGVTGVLAFFL